MMGRRLIGFLELAFVRNMLFIMMGCRALTIVNIIIVLDRVVTLIMFGAVIRSGHKAVSNRVGGVRADPTLMAVTVGFMLRLIALMMARF
jgi:hypothetical protein